MTAVVVRSVDTDESAPVRSKPLLKELTPKGEASVGVIISCVHPVSPPARTYHLGQGSSHCPREGSAPPWPRSPGLQHPLCRSSGSKRTTMKRIRGRQGEAVRGQSHSGSHRAPHGRKYAMQLPFLLCVVLPASPIDTPPPQIKSLPRTASATPSRPFHTWRSN